MINYRPQEQLRKGTFFTGVCQSFCSHGGEYLCMFRGVGMSEGWVCPGTGQIYVGVGGGDVWMGSWYVQVRVHMSGRGWICPGGDGYVQGVVCPWVGGYAEGGEYIQG